MKKQQMLAAQEEASKRFLEAQREAEELKKNKYKSKKTHVNEPAIQISNQERAPSPPLPAILKKSNSNTILKNDSFNLPVIESAVPNRKNSFEEEKHFSWNKMGNKVTSDYVPGRPKTHRLHSAENRRMISPTMSQEFLNIKQSKTNLNEFTLENENQVNLRTKLVLDQLEQLKHDLDRERNEMHHLLITSKYKKDQTNTNQTRLSRERLMPLPDRPIKSPQTLMGKHNSNGPLHSTSHNIPISKEVNGSQVFSSVKKISPSASTIDIETVDRLNEARLERLNQMNQNCKNFIMDQFLSS
jgi:hypothetical protein